MNVLQDLIKQLNEACVAYYKYDNPIMDDSKYDELFDKLVELESQTGIILAGSPTQNVKGYILDGFEKVTHSKPMLSAAKTKDLNEIQSFVQGYDYYGGYKLDGLTLVVKYKDGKFIQGITRGDGVEGEDVTEQCKFIKNLPLQIPYKDDLELRGECVISWVEFERINSTLEKPYSHPRNLAAGTLRNLDLNILKERDLSFVVFECVSDIGYDNKLTTLEIIKKLGFEIVEHTGLNENIEVTYNILLPEKYEYPTDGLIFELNSRKVSKSLGATSHHECCRMALKWEDELFETTLIDIEWNTSKTGLINPVAVFEPVDLDGAITTRATLHNVSYIENLELGIGDKITVYRANMVIPKVYENLTRSNTWRFPRRCPSCGGYISIHNENGSKTLHCTNPDCKAKLLGKLVHFCSKNAANIDGMSEATLHFLIERGWVKSFKDLYNLKDNQINLWKYHTVGFGEKSVQKLLDAIEKSRNITLDRFLYSLSIPLIGKSASKDISKACANGDIQQFITIMSLEGEYAFIGLDGFGKEMCKSIVSWWVENKQMFYELKDEFVFEKVEKFKNNVELNGKVFVITGSLNHYKNRDELVSVIESMGGKVSGSVSAKTDYLVNNDAQSSSSKNQKAQKLNIPIISEEDFIKMIS